MRKVIQKLSTISPFFVGILFLIIGFLLYSITIQSGFMGDDLEQIARNPLTQSIANIPMDFLAKSTFNTGGGSNYGLYYKPILLIFFTLGYNLGNHGAWLLHVTQILFHIANAFLIFLVFKKFFSRILAFLAGLLFLIHPVNIETIAYISNLQDALFFCFGMLAFLLVLEKKGTAWEVATQILLLCSLLSKETGILFVGMIGLYYLFFSSKEKTLRFFLFIIPTGIVYALMRFGLAGVPISTKTDFPLSHIALSTRLLYIPFLFLFYAKGFFWPSDLFVFQIWGIKTLTFYTFYGPLILLGAFLIATCLAGFLLLKKNKSLFMPFLFFGIWFFGGLLFHMQLIALDATAAGRWLYFPQVGLIGILCTLGIAFFQFKKAKANLLVSYFLLILFILLLIRSFIRVGDWQDQLTLYQHDWTYGYYTYTGDTKEFYYFSPLESVLAVELLNRGRIDEAKAHFEHAAQTTNDNYSKAVALNNLALIYDQKKEYTQEEKTYQQLLGITQYYIVYINYAHFLIQHGTPVDAKKFITYALTVYPGNAQLWYELFLAENALQESTEAQKALLQAKTLDPLIQEKNQPQAVLNQAPEFTKIKL